MAQYAISASWCSLVRYAAIILTTCANVPQCAFVEYERTLIYEYGIELLRCCVATAVQLHILQTIDVARGMR